MLDRVVDPGLLVDQDLALNVARRGRVQKLAGALAINCYVNAVNAF